MELDLMFISTKLVHVETELILWTHKDHFGRNGMTESNVSLHLHIHALYKHSDTGAVLHQAQIVINSFETPAVMLFRATLIQHATGK